MISKRSFRYYSRNEEIFQKFDRGGNVGFYWCMLYFFCFLYFTGIFWLVRFPVYLINKKRKLAHKGIIGITFSKNQRIINKLVIELTHLDFPVYDFVEDKRIKQTNTFTTLFVFLSAISNCGRTVSELQQARADKVLFNNFVRVIKISGLEYVFKILIDQNVKGLIKYNDHSPYSILLSDICKEKGVRTIYIQHAPVSEKFPPLYHDLNVLFSQDSIDKYKIEHQEVKIFVFFDIRFMKNDFTENISNIKPSVLLCPNQLDDNKVVVNLADELSDYYNVIIRPHPTEIDNWSTTDKYEVSKNRSVWEDLSKVNYVVTNESGILLEALHAKKICYKCAFLSKSSDSYGFIRQGLVTKEYFSQKELLEDMSNNKITYDLNKMQYFIGDLSNKDKKAIELKNEILSQIKN